MPKSSLINKFIKLTTAGLQSIGASVTVVEEESCVIVRDCIVDFEKDGEIQIYEAHNPENAIMAMPSQGVVSAASYICSKIATGLITRAIEDMENRET